MSVAKAERRPPAACAFLNRVDSPATIVYDETCCSNP
jgi:hypothetical protein